MKVGILRFDAPLVSFGAPAVDQRSVVQACPALSMLTGLFGNALGWSHADHERLEGLQERIRYAARIDRRGEALQDYQTVDLGLPWMLPELVGWTTRGRIAWRGESANAEGTHIRYRDYRADSVHTVAFTLSEDGRPTVDEVCTALDRPARPLFIGRKCCLPAAPIFRAVLEAPSLLHALASVPRSRRADPGPLVAWWWDGDDDSASITGSRVVPTTDERDWRNRIHVGRRLMREGAIDPPEASRD